MAVRFSTAESKMLSTDSEPASNAYHAHRERQRRRILEAAEKLFDEHGIDRVTMAEITSASGVRASTLYQYFSNKDDIVWAILSDALEKASQRVKEKIESATTGLSKITALLDFIADELSKNPAKARFMAQFDAMYARHWPAERLVTLEAQINPQGFRYFSKLIREGIADSSLRHDLDPDLTMHAVINAVIGAQRRLASLGNKVELEYGQPVDRLFRETIRVIVLGLRATESPAASNCSEPSKASKTKARKRRP
jgi:AcrR family transcriptional regulator